MAKKEVKLSHLWAIVFRDEKKDETPDQVEGEEKKEGEGLKGKSEAEEEEADQDAHFDDWHGVSREGEAYSSSDENESDDDDINGGLMMPIPE